MFFSRLNKPWTSAPSFQKKEWENVVYSPEFSCSYSLLSAYVLVVRAKGFSSAENERASLAFGAKIVDGFIPLEEKYAIIQDWRSYRGSSSSARKLFMDSVIANERLALLVFCNCTVRQSLSIKLSRALGFLKTAVHVCPTFREAKAVALGFRESGKLPPERFSLFRRRELRESRYNEDLLAYLESIDWKTGKKIGSAEPDVSHPLLPVFDTITVIRSGLEQTFQERDRAERELRAYQENLQILVSERTAALEASERRYRQLLGLSPAPIAIVAGGVSVEYVNEAFTTLFGYGRADIADAGLFARTLCSSPESEADFSRFFAAGSPSDCDFELRTASGRTVFAQVARNALDDQVILSFNDITDRKQAESRLFELSLTDDLTGIHNRRHFVSVLSRELQQYDRYQTALSLLIIDIDHFKLINDKYGHQAGDAVLRELTARISAQIRTIDYFFRIGGEEFAVIMPNTDIDLASVVAERLRDEIDSRPFDIGSAAIHVSISLGLAQADEETESPEKLFHEADDLLYKAKNQGRNRLCQA
jgi:diguanylate cyclase (GGDEF)-like protein/PAS domain S-box-containing protein